MDGETNIPEQQVQEVEAKPQTSGQQDVNWEARYKGSVTKINQLMERIKDLESQLAARASEVEQLKSQLSIKEVEKDTAIGEHSKKISELAAEIERLKAENSKLNAFRAKVDVIKELQRPELVKIMDKIPDLEDRDALKSVLQDFASFVDEAVKQREEQLLSGIIDRREGVPSKSATPRTQEAWMEYINSLPLGSIERSKALNDYGDWLERHYNERS